MSTVLSSILGILAIAGGFPKTPPNRSKLMTRNVTLSVVAGGLMSLAAALAVPQNTCAQDSAVLDDLYGRGVHAYFSRNSRQAVELLGEAIANGTADPRAYYFRGLALRTLGREEDAALDFKEGAKHEQAGVELIDVVSKSLERVQGGVRLEIENHRRLARLKTRNDRLAREKKRYEDITTDDERVLRKPATPRPATRPPAVLPGTTPPGAGDPFGEEPAVKPVPAPVDPAEEKPAVTPEPADEGTEPPPVKPATKPAADPFGEEPAVEPAPAPPAKPATKPGADPFGEDPADDPAVEPPAKPAVEPADPVEPDAAAATPPAAKPGKAGRSLFGALGKAILGESAAPAKPAIDTTNAKDPFADDDAEPAPVKTNPVPTKKPAPVEVEDPFSK
jgi:hypothetical protein